MSIIWLDGLITVDEKNNFHLQGGIIFMIINFLSILSAYVFFDSYRKNVQMQKAPYNLIFFKILFEGLLSLNIFIIFFCHQIFNSLDNFFIKFNSTFGPALLFLCCYLNGCLAHNIYLTYYDYRKSYEKRIKLYRISALIISGIIYLVTLVNLDFYNFYNKNNDNNSYISNDNVTLENQIGNPINPDLNINVNKNCICFKENFTVAFYIIGTSTLAYISHNLYYIVNKDHDYISFAQDDPRDETIKMLVRELVKRNVFLLSYTLFSFLPNNLIFFLKNFFGLDFLNSFFYLNFLIIAIISFNACYSFLVIISDPYMKKFFRPYYNLLNLFKGNNRANEVNKLSDLIEMVKDDGHDLTLNFLKTKSADYNYANIYLKTDIQEMKFLPTPHNSNNFENTNFYSFKKENNGNLETSNQLEKKSKDNNLIHIKEKQTTNDNKIKISLQNSELNLIHQTPNNIFNENFNNLITNSKVSQFIIGNSTIEAHNKREKDNVSEISFNRRIENSLEVTSMNSYDSSELLSSKKSNFNIKNYKKFNTQFSIKSPNNVNSMNSGSILRLNGVENINDYLNSYDYLNSNLEFWENISRMIAISIAMDEDRIYDRDINYMSKFASSLPWAEKYYSSRSDFKEFTQKKLPDWMNIKYDPRFKTIKVRICKYMPLVFHHLRIIDKISIDKILEGLDPLKNLENIINSKIIGGRSDNPIIYTWNKSFVLKTISKQEKNIFEKMVKDYQMRLRDTKTLICRIYGLYKIKVGDQYDSFVILMRNMCELPDESRFFTFDLKGSSVDRSSFRESQKAFYKDGFQDEIEEDHKNLILKDNDFEHLKLNFLLSTKDAKNFILSIENDAQFLSNYNITDYSLLVTIHKFDKDAYLKSFNCRVMKSFDDKYLYNFSIIDFLTIYDIEKFSEKITKDLSNIVARAKDKNISVQNAADYRDRFKKYLKKSIIKGD